MDNTLAPFILNIQRKLGAESFLSIHKMQSLWSDYGAIYRLSLTGTSYSSVVVKCITLQEKTKHPRGWATNNSHQRKLKSYLIENYWYENYVASLPHFTKVPQLLYSEQKDSAQVLVLEDLSTKYPHLKSRCTLPEAKTVVKWLARFHAHFLDSNAEGLWAVGSYWHLDTRQDEWAAMNESKLKRKANELDKALGDAIYKTIIHGDAKVANFCFGDGDQVAAVDFQYVGKGVGVKDLAYFIGSCFTDSECAIYESVLLDCYFEQLSLALKGLNSEEKIILEKEWRGLYPVAWADFNRFLLGWLPSHQKLHGHALSKNNEAFRYLKKLKE